MIMGLLLLWIESLVTVLLVVALLIAAGMRRQGRRGGRLLPALGVAGAGLLAVGLLVLTLLARYQLRISPDLVVPVGLWAAGVLVGVCLLLRRRQAWSWRRLGVAAMVSGVLLVTTFWNLDLAARIQLVTLRAQAGAMSLAVAPPRVPDRLNAALVYQRAWQVAGQFEELPPAWEDWEAWLRGKPHPDASVSPDDPELRSFLTAQQPVLDLLRRAAAMPDCAFDRNWGLPGPDLLLPELGKLRTSTRLLHLEARVRRADGQVAGALEDLRAILGLAAQCRSEPILISSLVAMAIEGSALDELEAILAAGDAGAADLATLSLEPGTPWLQTMRRSFQMEEAFGLCCFSQLGSVEGLQLLGDTGTSVGVAGPLLSGWRVFFLQAELADYRRIMGEYQHALARSYEAAIRQSEQLRETLTTEPLGMMTRLLVPALDTVMQRAWTAEARHQLVRVAVAIEAYRAQHGTPPAQLEDLVPDLLEAVPRDPFRTGPVQMTVEGDAILLRCAAPEDGAVLRLPR
jgi:hypothetical protein